MFYIAKSITKTLLPTTMPNRHVKHLEHNAFPTTNHQSPEQKIYILHKKSAIINSFLGPHFLAHQTSFAMSHHFYSHEHSDWPISVEYFLILKEINMLDMIPSAGKRYDQT